MQQSGDRWSAKFHQNAQYTQRSHFINRKILKCWRIVPELDCALRSCCCCGWGTNDDQMATGGNKEEAATVDDTVWAHSWRGREQRHQMSRLAAGASALLRGWHTLYNKRCVQYCWWWCWWWSQSSTSGELKQSERIEEDEREDKADACSSSSLHLASANAALVMGCRCRCQ